MSISFSRGNASLLFYNSLTI